MEQKMYTVCRIWWNITNFDWKYIFCLYLCEYTLSLHSFSSTAYINYINFPRIIPLSPRYKQKNGRKCVSITK